jgi:hypothetical protein
MRVILLKAVRVLAPFYVAMAPVAGYFAVGPTAPTWGLLALAGVFLVCWPWLRARWIDRLEKPAERREALEHARLGISEVLFLRSFAIDAEWAALQDFVLATLQAHNSRYADYKTVIAIGNEDDGAIAKLQTTTAEWRDTLRRLSESAHAIVIVPLHPTGKDRSGLLEEIVHTMDGHPDKTIYVMPPLKVWERHMQGTHLAGRLPHLWADTMARLAQIAPSLSLPPYEAAGCFWILGRGCEKFAFTDAGAAEVLFKIFDEQRIARAVLLSKYDPDGRIEQAAIKKRRQLWPGNKLPPLDERLF